MRNNGWLLVLIFAAPCWTAAQTTETYYPAAGSINSVGSLMVSARTSVLGPAFTGVSDDASALFYNPAGLADLSRGEITLHSSLGTSDTTQGTAVFGIPVGAGGGVGLAGSYLSHGTLEGRDELGSLTSGFSADRMMFQAGGAVSLFPMLSAGIAIRYSQQNIAEKNNAVFSPEFGLLLKPLAHWKLGFDYVQSGLASSAEPGVSVYKAGSSLDIVLDSSTRLLTALGCSFQSNNFHFIQAGLEASHQARYFLRVGYAVPLQENGNAGFSGFSFGGGLSLAGFNLNYAYLPSGNLGDTHLFSVGYPFGVSPGNLVGNTSTGPEKFSTGSQLKIGTAGKTVSPLVSPVDESSIKPRPPSSDAGSGVNGSVTVLTNVPGTKENSLGNPPKIEADNSPKDRLSLQFEIPPDFIAKAQRLEAQGLYADAIRSYNEALTQDPKNVQAWWSLGKLYVKLNQRENAIQCMEKALMLRPDHIALSNWLEKYKSQKP